MKSPCFNFFSDNFLSGTMFFTDEQVGKYIRLLCAQHLTGHLDEKHMIFICKSYDKDIWSKFKKDDDGLFFNERLEYEINKRNEYSKSRSNNKKGKGKKVIKTKKEKSYDNHMGNGNGNGNMNISTIKMDFEIFWNDYDKKVGDKDKLRVKWDNLTLENQEAILKYISAYKKAQPDKKFRKDPSSFLNNKSWNDEIIQSSPVTIKTRYLPI